MRALARSPIPEGDIKNTFIITITFIVEMLSKVKSSSSWSFQSNSPS